MRDFHYTVNVLVKAYLNNTLQHNNCYACAVGNIIADCQRFSYSRLNHPRNNNPNWTLRWSELPSIYDPFGPLEGTPTQKENWMNVFRDGTIKYYEYKGTTQDFTVQK